MQVALQLLFVIVPILCKWNKPIVLYSNTKSLTSHYGLFIEPITQIHHVVFHSWHIDKVFYKKLTIQGEILEEHSFSHPDMVLAAQGSMIASNNGKRLHVLLQGEKKGDDSRPYGLWYTESSDAGHTWSNVVNVADQKDQLSREGSAMVIIQETGRLFVFFSQIETVAPLQKRTVIKMASKPPGSTMFTQAVIIHQVPDGFEVRNALTAQYTIKNGKPIIHLIWASGYSHPDAMYYISSQDNGVTWSSPSKISGDDTIYPYNMIESTANKDFPSTFAGLYVEYSTNKRRVYVSNDNGNSFKVLDASNSEHSNFDQWMHKAGIALCGLSNQPMIFMLIDKYQAPMSYSVLDPKTMKITGLDRPFEEYGDDSSGITLACSTDMQKKEVTISAITEVGYGKPDRHLLLTTEIRKFN